LFLWKQINNNTVKPVLSGHPGDHQKVTASDRWLLN